MPSLTERIKRKSGIKKVSAQVIREKELNELNGSYEKYSFPYSDYHVENNQLIKSADVIHLHWVADFINYPGFFKAIQKPVVWTMHDMNPVLGGFHYEGDAMRNSNFENLEKDLTNVKAAAVSQVKNLTVVTPSRWLNVKARQSIVFRHASFRHIPYGLDCNVFKKHDRAFSASVFNLPANKKIILFVCENIETYRKGFDLILKVLEDVNIANDYVFVTVGASSGLIKNGQIIHIDFVNDERLMSLLYSAADLFILPSREDNFPNVILEAFTCGTPVLSFKTGGMFEVIQPGLNGFFADSVSAQSLANAINSFCNNVYSFDRNVIRDFAERNFSLETQASNYINIYKELLQGHA